MTRHRWTYPEELRQTLADFGLMPTPETPPALVREALDDLYKYELRRLRDNLRVGNVERADYFGRVVDLRKKYWALTLPLAAWEKVCREPE
jgi:hypothetical protein